MQQRQNGPLEAARFACEDWRNLQLTPNWRRAAATRF
jgi:hypothetical protein